MTTLTRRTILVVAVLAFSSAEASARNAQGGQARGRGEGRAASVITMLDDFALAQARNALQLDPQSEPEFIARLKRLQQTRRRTQQVRNGILQELRRLTAPARAAIDEHAVRERLERLRVHEERAAAEIRSAYDALDEVLDVRQRARFRVFEENLERRKLDLLIRARRGAGGGQ